MYKVVEIPNEILRVTCDPVTKFDKKLRQTVDRLFDTMYEYDGVGVAAPQVNLNQRLAVVHTDDETGPLVLINPEIIETSGTEVGLEGCLSIPGEFGFVERHETIVVKTQDLKGRTQQVKASGFFARAIQHEIDHLDGVLFTDKLAVPDKGTDQRIVFMGTPTFAVSVLERLLEEGYNVVGVVSQPDKPVGRKRELKPTPVKECALRHNIPVLQPEKVRTDYADILALEPDLIVTAAYGQIVPTELLEAPKHGAINVHASLLPKHRGGAPIHQAILDGDKETGVTIMYMVDKLDAGDMIANTVVPIEELDTVGTLFDKLAVAGSDLLLKTLPAFLAGWIEAVPQDERDVTFAPNISREREQIDWTRAGADIYNHIRGMNPFPTAYTTIAGERVKLFFGSKTTGTGEPGTIVRLEEDGFVVATGDAVAIKVVDLQPSGKKRMDGATFMRGAGQKLQVGDRLGG
ncbi:MAG: methionyl-tRNA formyltransferase [Exiguobacterium chiriqhucha]|uniref:Multifunctional fusion protein n=2 Tax=Bacillales Family XII. Incertae Sedis TaxID=539742 RepID=U1LGH2_9BACL|nr:methionyl-tRNA formyltransferase [Exiguobacterium chiriqhucha]ERG66448.1 methionyl-tRNA formyltransferase [Exiguobacterium chiriqhucha RW-2]KAB2863783.1 MAG: methionyl-tRNA formyltransferase [Exiguobacterium chiriqhucha]